MLSSANCLYQQQKDNLNPESTFWCNLVIPSSVYYQVTTSKALKLNIGISISKGDQKCSPSMFLMIKQASFQGLKHYSSSVTLHLRIQINSRTSGNTNEQQTDIDAVRFGLLSQLLVEQLACGCKFDSSCPVWSNSLTPCKQFYLDEMK